MFLAVFIPALWGALAQILASMVGRVVLALGISYITYRGADVAINYVGDFVKASISGGPASVVSFLAFMWVDKAISVTFSAFAAALAITKIGSVSKAVIGRK
jgi:hypothetical protein